MLVCFFIQLLTRGSRTIFKIVAKIKEAMVAFVYHWMSKITKQPYTSEKKSLLKIRGTKLIACHVKIFIVNRWLIQATRYRLGNYFLTESAIAFTVESTAFTVESIAFTVESTVATTESVFGASVVAVSLLLQAVNTDATAIAKNTFFIFVCLNFKNYNFIFIPELKKGNPSFIKYFFVVLGYQ